MNPISIAFFFVAVGVATVSAGADHISVLKAHFEEWANCPGRKGFYGMVFAQGVAAEKCQAMNIKEWNCFVDCYRYELGLVKDGKWQDAAAKASILSMWDAAHQVEAQKWYDDTNKCAMAYEAGGNMWEKNYAAPGATCSSKATDDFGKCLHDARVCKA